MTKLLDFLKRPLAALGIASLALAGVASAKEPAAGRPALWKLADKDTTIYLFGTIHLLPKNYSWRTPAFEQAINGSQALVASLKNAGINHTFRLTEGRHEWVVWRHYLNEVAPLLFR